MEGGWPGPVGVSGAAGLRGVNGRKEEAEEETRKGGGIRSLDSEQRRSRGRYDAVCGGRDSVVIELG